MAEKEKRTILDMRVAGKQYKEISADDNLLQTDGKENVLIAVLKRSPFCNSAGN